MALNPPVILEPFCGQGVANVDYIIPLQTTPDTDVVSQDTGYPLSQATPLNAGGIPVDRAQTNGALRLYSSIQAALQQGGTYTVDQSVIDYPTVGTGYAQGALLFCASNNSFQVSLKNNNIANFVTNPDYINDGVNWAQITSLGQNFYQQGRIYAVTGSPFESIVNSTNLYFGPSYVGNLISLYNPNVNTWITQTFSEISQIIADIFEIGAGALVDVYVYSINSTTVGMRFAGWVNANTPSARILQDGRIVESGSPQNLYVGTFYTPDGINICDWNGQRFLINMYNQIQRSMGMIMPGGTWDSTSSIIPCDGNTTPGEGQIQYLSVPYCTVGGLKFTASSTGDVIDSDYAYGLGLNTQSTFSVLSFATSGYNTTFPMSVVLDSGISGGESIGFNYVQQLDQGIACGGRGGGYNTVASDSLLG